LVIEYYKIEKKVNKKNCKNTNYSRNFHIIFYPIKKSFF